MFFFLIMFPTSKRVAHQVHNVVVPNFQVDDPDVCMILISYSNYDPHIITTPDGTVLFGVETSPVCPRES